MKLSFFGDASAKYSSNAEASGKVLLMSFADDLTIFLILNFEHFKIFSRYLTDVG